MAVKPTTAVTTPPPPPPPPPPWSTNSNRNNNIHQQQQHSTINSTMIADIVVEPKHESRLRKCNDRFIYNTYVKYHYISGQSDTYHIMNDVLKAGSGRLPRIRDIRILKIRKLDRFFDFFVDTMRTAHEVGRISCGASMVLGETRRPTRCERGQASGGYLLSGTDLR